MLANFAYEIGVKACRQLVSAQPTVIGLKYPVKRPAKNEPLKVILSSNRGSGFFDI